MSDTELPVEVTEWTQNSATALNVHAWRGRLIADAASSPLASCLKSNHPTV